MKKVKFDNEPSEIHVSQIDRKKHTLKAVKSGKTIGYVMYMNYAECWQVRYTEGGFDTFNSFDEHHHTAYLSGCEFYVLDE